jgi:hypothetical protein
MNRRTTWGLALLGAGAVLVATGLTAAARRESAQVTWDEHVFAVKRHDRGSYDEIELVRPDGSVAASFAGSTDLLCDPPRLALIDLDDDRELELYFTTCDEPGYVDHRGRGLLAVVELSEQQGAELAQRSAWLHQVQNGGWFLVCSGLALALAGATALLMSLLRRRPK